MLGAAYTRKAILYAARSQREALWDITQGRTKTLKIADLVDETEAA